jgi:hypothetical protein
MTRTDKYGIHTDDRGVRYVGPNRPIPRFSNGKALFADPVTCGSCHRTWDDAVITSVTPTPSPRCPFEHWHRGDPYRTRPTKSTKLTDHWVQNDTGLWRVLERTTANSFVTIATYATELEARAFLEGVERPEHLATTSHQRALAAVRKVNHEPAGS